LDAIFAWVFRDFAQIIRDFAQIFKDFARIFDNAKLLGVHLHPLHPTSYTTGMILRFPVGFALATDSIAVGVKYACILTPRIK